MKLVVINTRILKVDFDYFEPKTLNEAISLLTEYKEKAKILAGKTDLIPNLKKASKPSNGLCLINIKNIPELDHITEENGGLRIGAATSLRKIEKSKVVRNVYLSLQEAVRLTGTVQTRVMGTIGGNICNASPAADTVPPLLTWEAQAEVVSSRGKAVIPLEKFFKGPGQSILSSDELLAEIRIPHPPIGVGSSFLKIARVSADLAKINLATVIQKEEGVCKHCRIAFGAVAPTPIRLREVGEMLEGEKLSEELLGKMSQKTCELIKPITDIRSTEKYRRKVAKVLLSRAIKIAWDRAGGGK